MFDFYKNTLMGLCKYGWFLALVLLTSCAEEQNNRSIIVGMYYPYARDLILKDGWTPAKGMPAYEEIGATAHDYRRAGYAEVYDCTGSGLELCNFYFQNEKGEYLRIGTEGEENGLHKYPRIIHASIRNEIDQ